MNGWTIYKRCKLEYDQIKHWKEPDFVYLKTVSFNDYGKIATSRFQLDADQWAFKKMRPEAKSCTAYPVRKKCSSYQMNSLTAPNSSAKKPKQSICGYRRLSVIYSILNQNYENQCLNRWKRYRLPEKLDEFLLRFSQIRPGPQNTMFSGGIWLLVLVNPRCDARDGRWRRITE